LALVPLLAGLLGIVSAQAQPAAIDLLDELNGVALDPIQSYKVTDLYIRRDAVRVHLQHGRLVFFQPVRGRITGAVFEGAGETLVLPPDRTERAQLLRFSGSPILTESFGSAYLRFTDNTFVELLRQIRDGRGRPAHAPELQERWAPLLPGLNRAHSIRVLLDYVQSPPTSYFYAGINGEQLGAFDIIVDNRRQETVLVGQLRWDEEQRYYDVWTSFAREGTPPPPPPGRILRYGIEATITPERSLDVSCRVELELLRKEKQVLVFELSRFLQVEKIEELPPVGSETAARELEFLQNATLTAEEARYRGTDIVAVVLPAATPPGQDTGRRTLRFRYRGQVISDVGEGVLHVGARETWYPQLAPTAPAHFQLRFRYPHQLELAAVGRRTTHREDGAWKESLWVTDVPLPLAGFNIGDYRVLSLETPDRRVNVYANRRLEPELARVLRPAGTQPKKPSLSQPGRSLEPPVETERPLPPFALEQVAGDVTGALLFFSELFGPVPYTDLNVSQIPGRVGQGYPGLLYLSTFSFLPEDDQIRLGLDEDIRQHFSRIMPAHETAHQWWGNWVWVPDYRSQWLPEALASYSALLYLEDHHHSNNMKKWLEQYRSTLLEESADDLTVESSGALALGARLNSSHNPAGYTSIIYSKGPWVIHMLRELLRDPATGSDAAFVQALRALVAGGGDQPLTTEEFQRGFEAVLPAYADVEGNGRLDWFFQQWVHETGIPRYELKWDLRERPEGGWVAEGLVAQSGVADFFIMPVPVYARFGSDLQRLGSVLVMGEVSAFAFHLDQQPDALVLDPYLTVLSAN
jgi:hypothetical protein